MTQRIAVVGAGLAGVTAALALQAADARVVVFDKSRGFGGRLATRRGEGFSVDHGARAAHGALSEFTAAMKAAGAVQDAGDGGWIGQPGMSAIVRRMAEPLEHVLGTEVGRLEDGPGGLILIGAEGENLGVFERVVSAIPAPQARRFTGDRPEDGQLARVAMAPVWTLLLALPRRLDVDRPVTGLPFESVICASETPGREPLPETWVCHAGFDWTVEHLEMSREQVCRELTRAFAMACGRDLPEPIYAAAHRWRYGRVARPLGAPFLSAFDGRLMLGGDWALGDTAGDAFASGRAMAAALGN